MIIPPAAFLDTNFTSDLRFIFSGYIYSSGTPGASVCAGAPVLLPNGATILGVTAYAYDNDATQDIGFWLFKKNFKSTTPEIFAATFNSTGAVNSVQTFSDVTIIEPEVENSTNLYFVYACLRSPNHRIYAMQVDYTVTTFMPAIRKN